MFKMASAAADALQFPSCIYQSARRVSQSENDYRRSSYHVADCVSAKVLALSLMRAVQTFLHRVGLDQVHPLIGRMLVAVIGTTILLIGLLLIFLPGPGLIVILIGLAVLGSEFVWARRIIQRARTLGKNGQNYIRFLVKS